MPRTAKPSWLALRLPSNLPHMKSLIALIIFGWLAVVTFFGPELARAINAPEAPAHRRAR